MTPLQYGSTRQMAAFLMTLAETENHRLDLSIKIRILAPADLDRGYYPQYPEILDSDEFLYADNPLVPAFFSLTTVKKLHIVLGACAHFDLGVADELRQRFKEAGGSAEEEGRSIVIEKGCEFSYLYMEEDDEPDDVECHHCGNPWGEIKEGTADFTYSDDPHYQLGRDW